MRRLGPAGEEEPSPYPSLSTWRNSGLRTPVWVHPGTGLTPRDKAPVCLYVQLGQRKSRHCPTTGSTAGTGVGPQGSPSGEWEQHPLSYGGASSDADCRVEAHPCERKTLQTVRELAGNALCWRGSRRMDTVLALHCPFYRSVHRVWGHRHGTGAVPIIPSALKL